MLLHLYDYVSSRHEQDVQCDRHFHQLRPYFYMKTELLNVPLLWPRWSVITSVQREMQGDRETKESPAAVIGLLFFFCQLLKSLGTSLSFLLSLVSSPLSLLFSIPLFSALSFNSLLSFISLLCAKNIFIILLSCPHSAVPQHTNDSLCLCVRVCSREREREREIVCMCLYLCVCWRKCLWV